MGTGTPVYFDLDGTLCAPTLPFAPVFRDCCAAVLGPLPAGATDALERHWGEALLAPGPSTSAGCFARALVAGGIPDPSGALAGALAAALNRRWAEAQRLLPGAAEVLAALGRARPLGLISNGPADAQRAVVARLGLGPRFRWLLISGDADVGRRKPDPAIFALAAQRAGRPPAALLYVGDSPVNDIAGAAAAGWRTCWINPSRRPLPAGVPAPVLEIAELGALPAALAGLGTGSP